MLYPLSKLKIGQTARIILLFEHKSPSVPYSGTTPCSSAPEISCPASIQNRLLDLGFEPGTAVTCLLKKCGDELSAFLIKGAVIALRREDADLVLVEDIVPPADVPPANISIENGEIPITAQRDSAEKTEKREAEL